MTGVQTCALPIFSKKVGTIKIINNGWNRKHFKSIAMAYQKAPFLKDYISELEAILMEREYELLAELNFEILSFLLKAFSIERPIKIASEYSLEGAKSDLVLDMCVKLKATTYIFGEQGRNYADVASFEKNGVSALFQKYKHPEYKQLHGPFVPYMSAIDLLFNEGPKAKEILFNGNIKSVEDEGVAEWRPLLA